MFPLSSSTQIALRTLQNAGYEAYIVGGCVRDYLRGTLPQDIDITTNALPEETKAVFTDYRTIDTGIQHGTVTVLIDGQSFEITTYRVDVGYSDGRHPDAVQFTPSLREDAARRDFTVNAMAYHPDSGVVDFFAGQADLAARTIRCVGAPERRFSEDALRILRALRFASTLSFSIEAKTAEALNSQKNLLHQVSAERVTVELTKLLCGDGVAPILSCYLSVLTAYLPELSTVDAAFTGKLCHRVRKEPSLRYAALFSQLPLPRVESLLKRLRLDHKTKQTILSLLTLFHTPIRFDKPSLRRLIGQYSFELVIDALNLHADVCALTDDAQGVHDTLRVTALVREIVVNGECCSLPQLALRGADLSEFGLQGAEIGKMLHFILGEVLDGRMENNRETILSYIRSKRSAQ